MTKISCIILMAIHLISFPNIYGKTLVLRNKQTRELTKSSTSVPSTRGVSFSVSLSSATPKLGTKQTVIYDEVLTNDGDGYDDRTGVFECPVTGTYMFVVDSLSKGTITLGIKVNKEYVVFMHRSGHEHYIQISRTVIVKLNKGDHVKVDSIYMYGYVHPYNYSGFTGTLLY